MNPTTTKTATRTFRNHMAVYEFFDTLDAVSLGSGAYGKAFRLPKKTGITKVFKASDGGYLRFIELAQANQHVPNFPQFYGPLIRYKDDYGETVAYSIRMEELPNGGGGASSRFRDAFDSSPKQISRLSSNRSEISAMRKLAIEYAKGGVYDDLHAGNCRCRKDGTPVVTDPFVGYLGDDKRDTADAIARIAARHVSEPRERNSYDCECTEHLMIRHREECFGCSECVNCSNCEFKLAICTCETCEHCGLKECECSFCPHCNALDNDKEKFPCLCHLCEGCAICKPQKAKHVTLRRERGANELALGLTRRFARLRKPRSDRDDMRANLTTALACQIEDGYLVGTKVRCVR